MSNKELLEKEGWIIECESPFEIRHEDGSFATLNAANMILDIIRLATRIKTCSIVDDELREKKTNKHSQWQK